MWHYDVQSSVLFFGLGCCLLTSIVSIHAGVLLYDVTSGMYAWKPVIHLIDRSSWLFSFDLFLFHYSVQIFLPLPPLLLLKSTLLYSTLTFSSSSYSTLLYSTLLLCSTLLYSTLLNSNWFYSTFTVTYSSLTRSSLNHIRAGCHLNRTLQTL